MNWFDVAVASLIVVSVACGVRDGISRSGFGFLAIIVAFVCAAWLYPENQIGFLATFVALICAAAAGAFLLGKWFKITGTKWLDGLLGGAFGLTNALLFWVFAVMALMAFAPKVPRHYVARSSVAPYALVAARTMAEVVPDEMKDRIERSYQELEQMLPPRFRHAVPRLPRNEI